MIARFGSGRLTKTQIAAPAEQYAREGFGASRYVSDNSALVLAQLRADRMLGSWIPSGAERIERGALMRNPALAATLRSFGREGARPFYRGAIARAIVAAVRARGGVMTMDDLEHYEVEQRAPLVADHFGHRWVTAPLPSAGGYTMAQSLALMERWQPEGGWRDGAAFSHALTQSWIGAFLDRAAYLGDPDHAEIPLTALGHEERLSQRAVRFDPLRARAAETWALPLEVAEDDAAAAPPPRPGAGLSFLFASHRCILRRMNLPQLGEVLAYDLNDAVGRIRLDDGTELRFGKSAIPESIPVAGMKVRVRAVAPHPLGGFKATSLERVMAADESEIERKQREAMGVAREAQHVRDVAFELERKKLVAGVEARLEAEHLQRVAADEAARDQALRSIGAKTGLDAWRAALAHVGLTPRADALIAAALPTARLEAKPGGARIARGSSKLRGAPDLPRDFTWPTHEGSPLSFLAQISLAETPVDVRRSLGLPDAGVLAFFYAAQAQPWGFEASDRGSALVAYFADPSALVRTELPAALHEDAEHEEIGVSLVADVVLPPPSGATATAGFSLGPLSEDDDGPDDLSLTPALAVLGLGPSALARYRRAFAAYQLARDELGHVFGGYALPIQNAMEAQCAELDPASIESEWRLLLQLDSGDDVGQWGDDGRLYFWARTSDLRTRDFRRAWCILQSY